VIPAGTKTEEAVLRIAELIRRRGGRALLVGGCVRDALLQTPVKDWDLEVYGLSADAIRDAVSGEFSVDPVGMSFGVYKVHHLEIDIAMPRRESKTGVGHKGFMIETVPQLSFAEAAARRDFTVNAIMMDPLTREIIDPWNGQADLQRKILRHVSEHFSEDPLRVLRGMQFAGRLEFKIAPETVRLCRTLSQDELPMERIGSEWEKLLLHGTTPSLGLRFLRDCGWIRYYPELHALVGCAQSPVWHPEGDVWEHTLLALDAAVRFRTGNADDDLVLMGAALCHDFGKPAALARNAAGMIVTPGHDWMGQEPAETFMTRLWRKTDLVNEVKILVANHMKPAFMVLQRVPDRTFRRLALEVPRLDLLGNLVESDIRGTGNTQESLDGKLNLVQEFRRRVKDLKLDEKPPDPLILGRHLLARGVPPGPEMGKILKRCFDAQLDGVFSDESGAQSFLDRMPELTGRQ